MAFSFITTHLINKITDMINNRQTTLRHDSFLYFNTPVISDKVIVDRVNTNRPFEKDKILPLSFYHLNGTSLMEIYSKLKNNDFYIYKRMEDGKDYKIRLKVKNERA